MTTPIVQLSSERRAKRVESARRAKRARGERVESARRARGERAESARRARGEHAESAQRAMSARRAETRGERRRAEFGCEVLQQQQLQRVKAPIRGEDRGGLVTRDNQTEHLPLAGDIAGAPSALYQGSC